MKKTIIVIFTLFIFFSLSSTLSVHSLDESTRTEPPIRIREIPTVPNTHPRLLVTPQDVVNIKEKIQLPQFQNAWYRIKTSNLSMGQALRYLVEGNEADGRNAIKSALSALTSENKSRGIKFLSVVAQGAMVYDWCYPLLSSADKQAFIDQFKRIHNSHAPYWPAQRGHGAITSHNVEGWFWNQLIAGIAIYDEDPEIYQKSADILLHEFREIRDFFYPSHMHHQGWYTGTRFSHAILTQWVMRRLTGGQDLFSPEMQYMPYQLLYQLRPDGQVLRSGDTAEDAGLYEFKDIILLLTANYYHDPFLRYAADQSLFRSYNPTINDLLDLLTRPQDLESTPLPQLPLTKFFPEPVGSEMIVRSNWNVNGRFSDGALVQMRIGNYFFGAHQHKDFGTFQIYYKGNLTGDSGMYKGSESSFASSHWKNYYTSTTAHNGLLIIDPNESWDGGGSWTESIVDGGQRWPLNFQVQPKDLDMLLDPANGYQYGKLLAYEFGPDTHQPTYNYLSGDLTSGYVFSNNQNPPKVSEVKRSMVTMLTEQEDIPCLFFVFDRIVTTQPDFKTAFLLHAMQPPTVEEPLVTLTRGDGYRGKLSSYTLYPKNPAYSVVEGYKIHQQSFDSGNKKDPNHENMHWRVEVSPSEPQQENIFLHAMAVSDITQTAPPPSALESADFVGAQCLDYSVLFSRNGTLLNNAEIELSNTSQKLFVADLMPGTWQVVIDGGAQQTVNVSEQGRCLFLPAASGKVTFKRVN